MDYFLKILKYILFPKFWPILVIWIVTENLTVKNKNWDQVWVLCMFYVYMCATLNVSNS